MAQMTITQFMTGIKNWVLGKIGNITALIPSQASSSNQLADKAFVNSSIATATATFRGTYNVVSDLSLSYNATHAQIQAALVTKMSALSITPDNNDYAFVQIPTADATPTQIAKIEKYKYNGTAWAFEYELNNSGFTAAQWAAINSGATLELIGKLSALPTNAQLIALLDNKVSWTDNGAYDVTAHNSGATFDSLSAFLNSENLDTLIPTDIRRGGMSIKFVQSSDNKYVQFRCISDEFTTNLVYWQNEYVVINGKQYLNVSKDIAGTETSTTNIYNNSLSIANGKTIVIEVEDSSHVTDGTIQYKLNGGEVQSTGLKTKLTLTSALTSLRVYVYAANFTGNAGELNLIVREYAIYDNVEENTQKIGQHTTAIAQNTLDIAKNKEDIANNSQEIVENESDIAFIKGNSYKVEESLDKDGLTTFGKNVLKAGEKYKITLTSYNASNVDSSKMSFAVYSNIGQIYSKEGGTDLSGTVITITIPMEGVTSTELKGRANGSVILNIESLESNLKYIEPLQTKVGKLEDYVVNGYREDPTSSIDYEESSLFITALDVYRDRARTTAYIFPVSQGDVVTILGLESSMGYDNYRKCVFTTVKPVANATETHRMNNSPSTYNEIGETTYTAADNGYCYILDYYDYNETGNAGNQVRSILVNGLTVLGLECDSLLNRMKDVEDFQIDAKELISYILPSKMMSDHDIFGLESDWWITDKYLEDTYAANEATALNAFISKFRARAGLGKYQIAIISDTHGSGAYSWRTISDTDFSTCFRSIALFNKIVPYCDACIHGGDLSADYGTSRLRYLQYMQEIVRLIRVNKPLFVTKGNHDENNNQYIEADMLNLDFTKNTYYTRNFATFTAVTEDSWDGSPLYVNNIELISDKEFKIFAQKWASPSTAVWGNGAYYYYDINSIKLRVVVGNSFPVNDNHVISEDEEYLWLAQTALNLSAKATPSDWKVIMLRHTQSTSITNLTDCINAFRTGGSWTYGETTVDFGSINGGGMTFIAHVHGHEHQNCFSNGAGYFDIGENSAFVAQQNLGDASTYGLSVWTVDIINGKIYEDTIGGQTWVYNYNTNKLEIAVGDTITMAESGLARPVVASSSDTSKVTCNGRVVTAVSAGDVTITMTGNNGNTYEYPITVVAS